MKKSTTKVAYKNADSMQADMVTPQEVVLGEGAAGIVFTIRHSRNK